MEKSKAVKITVAVVTALIYLALFVGAFCLNIWAGICAVGFFAFGYWKGFNMKALKEANNAIKLLENNVDAIKEGKVLTLTSDEFSGEITIQVKESTTKKKETKKEKKEK